MLTKHVGEISAGNLQQKDIDGRIEVGVDDLSDVARHNLREIGQSAASYRLDGRNRDLVIAEGAAQHGEEMPDILPFDVQYQYRADEERHDLPDGHQHVGEVTRQSHLLLHSAERSDQGCEKKLVEIKR